MKKKITGKFFNCIFDFSCYEIYLNEKLIGFFHSGIGQDKFIINETFNMSIEMINELLYLCKLIQNEFEEETKRMSI